MFWKPGFLLKTEDSNIEGNRGNFVLGFYKLYLSLDLVNSGWNMEIQI